MCSRFPDDDLLTAFGVMGMRPLSTVPTETWGNESIKNLSNFYGQERTHKYYVKGPDDKMIECVSKSAAVVDKKKVMTESVDLKNIVLAQLYPRDNFGVLWEIIGKYHKDR